MGNDWGLPTVLNERFDKIWQGISWVGEIWHQYEILFASEKEHIELLNKAAPGFFHIVQWTFVQQVCLGIAKLTDPPKTAGKTNLSIEHFIEQVEQIDSRFAILIRKKYKNDVEPACAGIRDFRKKLIAHTDHDISMRVVPEPPFGISRKAINGALASIYELLSFVEKHCGGGFGVPSERGATAGNAQILLRYLRIGNNAFQLALNGELDADTRQKILEGTEIPAFER